MRKYITDMLKAVTSWPMTKVGVGFMDVVTGHMVDIYEDRYGRKWQAISRWDFGRVRYGVGE